MVVAYTNLGVGITFVSAIETFLERERVHSFSIYLLSVIFDYIVHMELAIGIPSLKTRRYVSALFT